MVYTLAGDSCAADPGRVRTCEAARGAADVHAIGSTRSSSRGRRPHRSHAWALARPSIAPRTMSR